MDPMELTPIGYRYKEAGKLLTVSEPTVIRLIQAGKLERLQVTENRFVVSRESLSAYMDAVKGGQDLKTYCYTAPQSQRRSSAPEERQEWWQGYSRGSGWVARGKASWGASAPKPALFGYIAS